MLLYIFWHWPRPEVALASYEADEADFQSRLHEAAPIGLIASAVHRCEGAPWANEGGAAYEDLYILDTSAAMDVLNQAAVDGACKKPHDRLAGAMLAGTAGLYSLSRGRASAPVAGPTRWFRKPPGMSYNALYGALSGAMEAHGATLWRRQMVLSPAPEFSAFGCDPSAALPGLEVTVLVRDLVWSSEGAAGTS
jgi:hypothetical protein